VSFPVTFAVRPAVVRATAIIAVLGAALTATGSSAGAQEGGKSSTSGTAESTGTTTGKASGSRVRARARAALDAAAAAEAGRRPAETAPSAAATSAAPTRAAVKSTAVKSAAVKSGTARGSAAKGATAKSAAPRKLTARERVGAELRSIATRARAAMVVQDTATLARLWSEDYIYTSLSGETYSKAERLESVMSPNFVVDEAPDVLPSEQDIVRLYGDVAVVHSRLAPAATTRSGARGGRARLLTVWARERGTWRMVAAQATGVGVPEPAPPAKKKK